MRLWVVGDGSDMDMSKLINEMLEQMTTCGMPVYEPMKEMYDKYPAWMEENEKKISADDRSRYLNQYRIISDVVLRFEKPEYSDDNEVDRKYITALMEQCRVRVRPHQSFMGDLHLEAFQALIWALTVFLRYLAILMAVQRSRLCGHGVYPRMAFL